MKTASIWMVATLLIAELAATIAALVYIAIDQPLWLTDELRTVTACILFGGLGGVAYCLRGVYLNACVRKQWDLCWLPWYYVRPILSLVFGGVSYLFVKSGLLLLGVTNDTGASPLGIWALAFLAGLNVDKFLAKIEAVGETVWGIAPSRQSKSEPPKDEKKA